LANRFSHRRRRRGPPPRPVPRRPGWSAGSAGTTNISGRAAGRWPHERGRPMRVFITGGTGLIGKRLVQQLLGRGDQPVVLTRRYAAARQMFGPTCGLVEGDPMQPGEWTDAVADCDAVINLAGENVFGRRWNEKFKALLFDSRVQTTQNVAQA